MGAIGQLQFEVVEYRLKSEYGAESRREPESWSVARWISPAVALEQIEAVRPSSSVIVLDSRQQAMILFNDDWQLNYFVKRNPTFALSDVPFSLEDVSV